MSENFPISVNDFSVNFGPDQVLKNLNLRVEAGTITSIVGPSGSGKSTLLHALAGFIPSLGDHKISSSVGFVFQKDGVFPFMTVADNIKFALKHSKHKDKAQSLEYLLKSTGLSNQRYKYPACLSGGQLQRLNFARAFASDSSVILCDEPFSALDEVTRMQMQEWLLTYWENSKKTIIFVTHSLEEAAFLSDQICVLKEGKIVSTFPVPFRRPRLQELRFSAEFIELKKRILEIFN